jgi:hypothetical protein
MGHVTLMVINPLLDLPLDLRCHSSRVVRIQNSNPISPSIGHVAVRGGGGCVSYPKEGSATAFEVP